MKCPSCNNEISVGKEWTTVCRKCGKVISTKRQIYPPSHYLNGTRDELLQTFITYVERNLSLKKWSFHKSTLIPKELTVIYNSEFCRVKFTLRGSDYGPLYASFIHYGRLHAPDNEPYMIWKGEKCPCWHFDSNTLKLTLPFLEGLSPQKIAMENAEFWQSRENSLGAYPADRIEYPLILHSKIWERYGEKLFSVFDLRQSALWEEYSIFIYEYKKAWHKRLKTTLDIDITHDIKKIC